MTSPGLTVLSNGRIQPDQLSKVSEEVALVEEELYRQINSQVELVANVSKHTLRAGGKRLRPAFVALAAQATGLEFSQDRARLLGACMEMIHMATLIHDDVVDNSATRRGKPTASAIYGNTASILSGDVLLAKAMVLLAQDGDIDIIRCTSEAVVDMAEGEVRELEVRGDFDLDEEVHLHVLSLKTASFVRACCETGALVAGANSNVRSALRTFGLHVGMAFQIVDDLLDYRGDKIKTGKPIATDFREGQATLPLIYLRETLSDAETSIARRRFGGTVNEDEIRMIADWMETRGAFDRAETLAKDHVQIALDAIRPLPDNDSKALLETVAEYVLLRQS